MKSRYAEDLKSAIAVVTAVLENYYESAGDEPPDTVFAETVANEIAAEPDGPSNLISGFVNLTIALLDSIERDKDIAKQDVLRAYAAAVALADEGELPPS